MASRAVFRRVSTDFFDFIVIDECHRGGANDESNWRDISSTSPRPCSSADGDAQAQDNVDTYAYFGEPVYVYSLKEGINDGFLTPFKVKQIRPRSRVCLYARRQADRGRDRGRKRYTEADFNKVIEIREREAHRVKLFMEQIDQSEKTLVFCATQDHALAGAI